MLNDYINYIDFDAIKLGDLADKLGDFECAATNYSKALNRLRDYQGDRMLPIYMGAGLVNKLDSLREMRLMGNGSKSILIFDTWKLSKSSYVKGTQCEKYLYLDKHKKGERKPISKEKRNRFDKGHRFEDRFRSKEFPNGVNIKEVVGNFAYFNSYTKYLLDSTDKQTLYEATIIENEVLIMCDVLKKDKHGKVDIYEVKSSKGINEAILNGLSIQYYVCKRRFGNSLNSFNLVSRKDEDGEEWSIRNLTEVLEDRISTVDKNITNFKKVLLKSEPQISIGIQCQYPYECEFIEYCRKPNL